MQPANLFTATASLGYAKLVPIIPPDAEITANSLLAKKVGRHGDPRGKAVGVKGSRGQWHGYDWLAAPTPEQEQLDAWCAMGAGVGIRTEDGLVALDIDSTDEDTAKCAEALALKHLGPAPIRIGNAPKRLLVYTTTEARPYQSIHHDTQRIELLTKGRQFVAYGIHPKTRKPYVWLAPLTHVLDLARVTQAQLDAFFNAFLEEFPEWERGANHSASTAADRQSVDQARLKGDLAQVAKAVSVLPNDYPDRDDYIRVGVAIKAATQDDPDFGLELYHQWAGRWTGGDNDPDTVDADWRRMKPPYAVGADYLYALAETKSGGEFSRAPLYLEPIEDSGDQAATQDSSAMPVPERSKFDRLKTFTFDELANPSSENLQPLIKGLLFRNNLSVIYGPSNVGKTFLALDMAFHIATGSNWAGLRTRHHSVLYLAMEGEHGIRKRVRALKLKYPDANPAMRFVGGTLPMFKDKQAADFIIGQAKALQDECRLDVGLVVIDTLARAMAGGDENNATDMGVMVAAADYVKEATGANVTFIHHTGKDARKGMRGSYALLAGIDTQLEVGDGVIRDLKQRDTAKGFDKSFKLEVQHLGLDEDGDPVTSCTVSIKDAVRVVRGVPSPKEQSILDCFDILSDGVDTVSLDEIHTAIGVDNLSKESLRKMLARLCEKGLVAAKGQAKYVAL